MRKKKSLWWGDMKRNSVALWDFTTYHQVRAHMEALRSSWLLQPALTTSAGTAKMAPCFLLQNSPTSPGCLAEVGTLFHFWQSWRLSTHTLACRLPEGFEPRPSSQAGPIVRLDLCTAKVSEQPKLTLQGSGEQLGLCQAASHSSRPSGMQQDIWNPNRHLPLKLYILLANGLLIIPQWLVVAAVSSLSSWSNKNNLITSLVFPLRKLLCINSIHHTKKISFCFCISALKGGCQAFMREKKNYLLWQWSHLNGSFKEIRLAYFSFLSPWQEEMKHFSAHYSPSPPNSY